MPLSLSFEARYLYAKMKGKKWVARQFTGGLLPRLQSCEVLMQQKIIAKYVHPYKPLLYVAAKVDIVMSLVYNGVVIGTLFRRDDAMLEVIFDAIARQP
ncbi:hypothetical protein O1611_g4493 [Lasiodiplodia mahajangana]|uniref:Uncharacterized protein n=1 Tax=Lasiodiplodia mahajangana TaxID=1108764 RepID=A0ACC2JNR6_9PEZI|nr:hypothetical protein O1611_g4493 [Lasiodiplodia mahajangana]